MESDGENNAGYYIRSINKLSRWPDAGDTFENAQCLQADAITAELRTGGNKLSWWKINDLENETLAQITASLISICDEKPNNIISIVAVPCDILEDSIKMEKSLSGARTAVTGLMEKHYDSINMSCEDIEKVAGIIAKAFIGCEGGAVIKEIDRDEALEHLVSEYEAGSLNLDILGNWAREQIRPPYEIAVADDELGYIRSGTKQVELQLLNEKYKKIAVSDKIKFFRQEDDSDVVHAEIVGLYRYANFAELVNDYDSSIIAGHEITKDELVRSTTNRFPLRKQNKHGVIGIKFKVLET